MMSESEKRNRALDRLTPSQIALGIFLHAGTAVTEIDYEAGKFMERHLSAEEIEAVTHHYKKLVKATIEPLQIRWRGIVEKAFRERGLSTENLKDWF
jgi:hypothetical protein